ncbi:hypothetical protein [Dokdonella sp.]|uniref:hypothetical protein n=1 Tax=Dokdonella sp. TaxID=2291710 RepID=UPI0025C5A379|nr:hypothetical protein [Dokdonella sp.]MBX3691034.1 hypothetical protein [Dokdonella sp.]
MPVLPVPVAPSKPGKIRRRTCPNFTPCRQAYASPDRAKGRFDAAARRLHESFGMLRSVSGDSIYTWLTAMLEVQALTLGVPPDRADARAAEAVAALQRVAPDDPYNSTFVAATVGSLREAQGRHAEAVAWGYASFHPLFVANPDAGLARFKDLGRLAEAP